VNIRIKQIIAWLLLFGCLFSWAPLFSNQSGDGLVLPEVVVVGEDRARLEGFRDFGLLPALAPGIKLEPMAESLTLAGRETSAPRWETATSKAPGCAYRNPVTASLARGLGGAEAYYSSGRQKYLEGLMDEAENYFRLGLKKYPASPQAPDFHYWLGEIAFRRHDYAAARRHFQAVAEKRGGNFYDYACYSLALLDYREKNYPEAVKWFAEAVKSPDARLISASLFWQAEALLQLGRTAEGEADLRRLVAEFANAAEYRAALYRLATLAFNRQDYRAAMNYLAAMPRPASGSDMLQRQADLARGWCLQFLKAYPEALAVFQRLRSEKPGVDDVVPLAFLGEVLAHLRQSQFDPALAVFEQRPAELKAAPVAAAAARELIAAAIAGRNPDAAVKVGRELTTVFPAPLLQVTDFRTLARLEGEKKDFPAALATIDRGLEAFADKDLEQARLQLEQAQILTAAGRMDEALAVLKQLFARKELFAADPADRDLLYLLYTRALNHQKQYAETLKVLALLPPDSTPSRQADLLYERGWAALKSQLHGQAVDDFTGFLNLEPKTEANRSIIENAELNRVEALFNLHRDEEVEALLEDFIHRHPESRFVSRARNYLGLIAMRQGEFEKASAIFTAILSGSRQLDSELQAEVLFNLGESLFSQEKFSKAISVYQRLVDEYPGTEISGRALIRMGESWFNLGDYLKSQLVYLKAKQAFPGGAIDEKASYGMLLLAYNQDKFDYLEIEVKRFIKRFPDSSYTVPLFMLLVDLYHRQQRSQDLLRLLRELETGDYPRELKLEAYYRHFQLDLKAGRKAAAAASCRSLIKLFPGSKYDCDCRLFLARQAFDAGRSGAALTWLYGLMGKCPDQALHREAVLLRARIYQQQGDFTKARRDYLEIVDQNPQDAQAYQAFVGLGRLLADHGKYDDALFFYEKAAANPDRPAAARAALARVKVLEKAGRPRQALEAALRVSYLFPRQKQLSADALLQALRLARMVKDQKTLALVRKKLEACKLTPAQQRELKKFVD
jgi:tetratricopeptide (TPR) repeat protein